MDTPLDLRRLWVLLLLLSPSVLAADLYEQPALDEDFLLFLDEWVDDVGNVFEADKLEPLQEASPPGEEQGEAAHPQEVEDA